MPRAPLTSPLPRTLGVGTAALAVVGVIIGSGIFRVPGVVAGRVDAPAAIMALWVTGGLLTLCLGLIYAELGSALPVEGGTYAYLRAAFGDGVAFVFGWTFLVVNPASWATLALTCAEFMAQLRPSDALPPRALAVALIVACVLVNCGSVRFGASLQGAASAAKLLALAAAVAAMISLGGHRAPSVATLTASAAGTAGHVSAWLTALVAVLWAYDGAAGLCSLGGEVRAPERNLPRALLIGVLAVMVVYVAINLGLLAALAPATIAAAPLPIAVAVTPVLGASAATWVAWLVILSTAGSLAVSVLADPRVFMAMARDGNFFAAIGTVSRSRHTPVNAIVLHGALACAYVSVRGFEALAATYVLGLVPFYVLSALAVVRLRRSAPRAPERFRAPALTLLCVVWIVAALLLVGNAWIETPAIVLGNLVFTAAGIPLYLAWRRLRSA
jgi:amino acid transporter